MNTEKIHAIYFSPAKSTYKIVKAMAAGISENVVKHDITFGLKENLSFERNEFAIIGVPVYFGRVPQLAFDYLMQIQADKTPVIIVCVYGNRDYDDALLELKSICTERGFHVISAGAFIARHSVFPEIAKNRPNQNDYEIAASFGKKSERFYIYKQAISLNVKGNYPYKPIKSIPFKPKVNSNCNLCAKCINNCPTKAINKNNPRKTNKKKCMSCGGCIVICPQNARSFNGFLYNIIYRKFIKSFSQPKEVELFYLE